MDCMLDNILLTHISFMCSLFCSYIDTFLCLGCEPKLSDLSSPGTFLKNKCAKFCGEVSVTNFWIILPPEEYYHSIKREVK